MEPVGLAVTLAQTLLQTVTRAITWWNQTENAEVAEELNTFAKNLKHNIGVVSWRKVAKNATSSFAIEVLQEDLRQGNKDAERVLMKDVVMSLWKAKKTMSELVLIHQRVITSFQIQLLFIIVDVTLDGKGLEKFHAAIERVQADLMQVYSAPSTSKRKELNSRMRKDLQEMFTPLLAEMRFRGQTIEEVIFIIKGDECNAQTDDLERIFADLVAAAHKLDTLSKRDKAPVEQPSTSRYQKSDTLKWYHDPITWEVMCDPVKASDRRTYDRWTLIHHASSMRLSPFDRSPDLQIIFDDIDVRGRLFEKYPEQEYTFRNLREKYRQEALEKANSDNYNLREVLVMLNHVLAWAENDAECRAKRDEIDLRISGSLEEIASSSPSISSSPNWSSESSTDSPEYPASPHFPQFPQYMSWLERAYAEQTKGDGAFSDGDFGDAVVHYTSAISLAPQSEVLYSKRSASNACLHRYPDALEDAKIILNLKPGWAEGYFRLGVAYQGMKRYHDAITAYKKGLEADPDNEAMKAGLEVAQEAHRKDSRGYKFFICSQSHILYLVISFVTLRVLQEISH